MTSRRSPAAHVLLDGIHALHHEDLAAAAAVSVYVAATREVCLARRSGRDVADRGRTEESVRRQFDTHVWPMAEQFVLPSRTRAHVVVEGEGNLDASIQPVLDRLAIVTQR